MPRRRARTAAVAVSAVLMSSLLFAPSPAAAQGTFPLDCRGGGRISLHFAQAEHTWMLWRPGPARMAL
jgi:hypothetical protein